MNSNYSYANILWYLSGFDFNDWFIPVRKLYSPLIPYIPYYFLVEFYRSVFTFSFIYISMKNKNK